MGFLAGLWRFGRVIWVCRVAVLGVVAGGSLLAYTVQARDLFADLGIRWWEWPIFFVLVYVWAAIVHQSARRSLQNDDWVSESRLGILDNPLPALLQRPPLVTTVRSELQELYWWPALVIPRALSFLVFFFVGFAILRVYLNLDTAKNGLPEAAQAVTWAFVLLALNAVAFLFYAWRHWKWKRFGDWIVATGWSYLPPLLAGTAPLFAARLPGHHPTPTPAVVMTPADRFWFIARIVTVSLLAVTIFNPHLVADWSPRLYFIPLLFGGGVVLLSELAAWSMRWQTPLLLMIAGLSLLFVFVTANFHDTRWITTTVEPSPAAGAKKQITIDEAVQRWRAANNNCTDDCPRPILIAAAGGASRAGFYAATVVGALMDLGRDKEKGQAYGDIRSRIFALSTVSGGSVGAAVIRAAMLDAAARGKPHDPPCQIAGRGSWFGQPLMATDKSYDPTKNWRDCFQAVMAGDFLSPVFVGLAYRDNFPFSNPFTHQPAWADRAVLLEQAFERRYRRFTADDRSARSCPNQPSTATSDYEGMCRPFGHHPDAKTAGAWVPIFFINGTSVYTGRRIVVSDVETISSLSPGGPAFMPMAYDLYDRRTDYIRLSTAATMSARFPVISPQGVLRGPDGKTIDQIVDGGYFENDGLATIMEVARALKLQKLEPVVVRIRNEPDKPSDPMADRTRPPPAKSEDRSVLDDIFAIARALIAARSGHEDQFAVSVTNVLGDEKRFFDIGVYEFGASGSELPASQLPMKPAANPVCRREVNAAAKLENVSMSWWMSQPVQAYLDAQLCLPANWERLECELRDGRTAKGDACEQSLLARTRAPTKGPARR